MGEDFAMTSTTGKDGHLELVETHPTDPAVIGGVALEEADEEVSHKTF